MKKLVVGLCMAMLLMVGTSADAAGKNEFVQAVAKPDAIYYMDNLSLGYYENKDYFAFSYIKTNAAQGTADLGTIIVRAEDGSYKQVSQEYLQNSEEVMAVVHDEKQVWTAFGQDQNVDMLIAFVKNQMQYQGMGK